MNHFFILMLITFGSIFAHAEKVLPMPLEPGVNWQKTCIDYGDDSILTTRLNIRDYKWHFSYLAFEEKECKTPWLLFETEHKVRQYNHDLDMTFVDAYYTSLTDETTQALNMVSFCGIHDWKTNQRVNVTGKACQDFQVPQSGDMTYSFFELEKKDEKTWLHLGTAQGQFDGRSPEGRHQQAEKDPFELLNRIQSK